jgi:hypothetical protein
VITVAAGSLVEVVGRVRPALQAAATIAAPATPTIRDGRDGSLATDDLREGRLD